MKKSWKFSLKKNAEKVLETKMVLKSSEHVTSNQYFSFPSKLVP
jgi:hypothetical protein